MSSMQSLHKTNRKVHYMVIEFKLSEVVPLGVILIQYRRYLKYGKWIKQTELEKVVKEYDLQRGMR